MGRSSCLAGRLSSPLGDGGNISDQKPPCSPPPFYLFPDGASFFLARQPDTASGKDCTRLLIRKDSSLALSPRPVIHRRRRKYGSGRNVYFYGRSSLVIQPRSVLCFNCWWMRAAAGNFKDGVIDH